MPSPLTYLKNLQSNRLQKNPFCPITFRAIQNLSDHDSLSMPNPMTYLKNFKSNRFTKIAKKLCPDTDQNQK